MGYTNSGINTTTLNTSTSLTSLTKDGIIGNLKRNNSVITDIYKRLLPEKSITPEIDFSNPQKSHHSIHSLEKKEQEENKTQTSKTNTELTSKQLDKRTVSTLERHKGDQKIQIYAKNPTYRHNN